MLTSLQDSNTQQGTRKVRLCEHHSMSQVCKALDSLNLLGIQSQVYKVLLGC